MQGHEELVHLMTEKTQKSHYNTRKSVCGVVNELRNVAEMLYSEAYLCTATGKTPLLTLLVLFLESFLLSHVHI